MNPLLPTREELESAAAIVYGAMPPTPQYRWSLLEEVAGARVWVKHENHTPIGAFKVRGGLVYMEELVRRDQSGAGVISATRGNHGQSLAFAGRRAGVPVTIVVPHGNSREKNAAMRALGARLVEHGTDFQEAREHASALAAEQGLHLVPSWHRDLVRGVASYWLELFQADPEIEVVFVPIGLGSGICAALAARAALGLSTRIIGVVSAHALAYKLSFEQRKLCESPATTRIADGLACRLPDEQALAIITAGVDAIIAVSDDEVEAAMRLYFTATHNLAEGAGAVALAGALQCRSEIRGRCIGLPLTGGNVDHDQYARVLLAGSSSAQGQG